MSLSRYGMSGPEITVELNPETLTTVYFSSKSFAVLETGVNEAFHTFTLWVDEDTSDVSAADILMKKLAPISDPCSSKVRGAVTFAFTIPHTVLPPGTEKPTIRVENCFLLPHLQSYNPPEKREEHGSSVAALLVWRIFSDAGTVPELKLTTT